MVLRSWLFALACVGALAACENQPFPGQNPTPPSAPAPPPAVDETVVIDDTVTSTTTPSGTTTTTDSTVVVVEEDESPSAAEAERGEAVEDCYAYAAAQAARDYQMQSDSSSVIDSAYNSQAVPDFKAQMNGFGNERRRETLYNDCMSSRGFPQ